MAYKGENFKKQTNKKPTGLLGKNSDRAVEVGERKEPRESEGRRKVRDGQCWWENFMYFPKAERCGRFRI